jgi:hypothetical protein
MNEKKNFYIEIQTVVTEILQLIDCRNNPVLPALGFDDSAVRELKDKMFLQWQSEVDLLISSKELQLSTLIDSWKIYFSNEMKMAKSKNKSLKP